MTIDPHAFIASLRDTLTDARLDLADAIREACPKPHSYAQHRDGQPAWCEACGYAEDGTRVRSDAGLSVMRLRRARPAAGSTEVRQAHTEETPDAP